MATDGCVVRGRQQVNVHGTITRADSQGVCLPAVHVESLQTVQPANASSVPAAQ
ncbi:hypothetical protein [Paraburkholderia sp. SIMBA_054]|jgi:hypothetical protein|uniref:hypothetical protein n=1 Tax=Paraburkholderia TaxID=1822464 RepID=UPI00397D0C63